MSNKLILDLTVRLTEALDQNYDVVNMDTVLAVISALEGATITKEQLETTRLAKHINQLRRRNKSNILAIRAKNLLKKWREMFGITSQAQSEVVSSVTQQAAPTQQPVPKPPLSSTSQPASPYTNTQLLGENFDNSLSSIGVEFNRTTTVTTSATCGGSNTGSANFTFNKKSGAATAAAATNDTAVVGSRSNGALVKNTNRNITNNSSPASTVTTSKVKHPTSFKNLITGISVNNVVPKQASNPSASALSPKVPPQINATNTEAKLFVIDDDDNQSQPSSTSAAGLSKTVAVGVSSPRTHKSTKRKERNSPVSLTFIEQSSSPIPFENLSREQSMMTTGATGRVTAHSSTRNNSNLIITSTIDLHSSNSNSNFAEVSEVISTTVGGRATTVGISSNSSNKRIRKDKKRFNERVDLVTESEHFQPTIDESSRIAFPISGIQEYLSLSNSSMSIFPAGTGGAAGGIGSGTERFLSAANVDDQPPDSSTERDKPDGDLTFAGKFKQNSTGGIEVGSSSSYYKGGGTRGENMSMTSSGGASEFPCGNMKIAINNSRDSVSAGGGGTGSTSVFLPFSRNSNESSSTSRTSQLDLIDVVNQDSQSMTTIDDLGQHHRKQSSNEKSIQESSIQIKFPKDVNSATSNKAQQHLNKDHMKSSANGNNQRPLMNASSKPSTPTSVLPIVCNNTVSSPPAVDQQKIPKKRGRKKGSKGVDSVLAQSAGLSSQFLMGPALGSNKKVKTTRELLIDIQSRKMGSATSSPTLMNWFASSRPASSCSEPSLHSPRTSDANSTNATMSTAARSTPEKTASNNSIAADELYESDSDTNTSEPSHDSVKIHISSNAGSKKSEEAVTEGSTAPTSSIEERIKELMALLPEVDTQNIDWEAYEDIPCTCTLREIPPEIPVSAVGVTSSTITENDGSALDLLENADSVKNEDDEEEPIISVSVLPISQEKQKQSLPIKPRSPLAPPLVMAHHSQSAPVSTVTSPVVPPPTKIHKPIKSIFDLDFDDDNDPLHMFLEAASKTKNGIVSNHHHPTEKELSKKLEKTETENELDNKDEHHLIKSLSSSQSEQQGRSIQQKHLSIAAPPPAAAAAPAQTLVEPMDLMMPLYFNFPTYEAVEDPNCEAKQRYEVQTNQITSFHINAFHNCYIPNVNGNWDHSLPQNVVYDEKSFQRENESLYANVVPKYGCLITERIPKDLSHVKFTKNFKPNTTKKSDKPPLPFLGVANINRRQHFRLHQYHRKVKKNAVKQKKRKDRKKTKVAKIKEAVETVKVEVKDESVESVVQINDNIKTEPIDKAESEISKKPEGIVILDSNTTIAIEVDIGIKMEKSIERAQSPVQPLDNVLKTNLSADDSIQQQQDYPPINDLITHSPKGNFKSEEPNTMDQTQSPIDDGRKTSPIPNGNIPHLMNNNNNNNSIMKSDDQSGCTKLVNNSHNNTLHIVEVNDLFLVAASRRSSSCSNSSLKQNQNSINMKLRRHRLEQLQLAKERQGQERKRKHLASSLTDVFECDDADEAIEQAPKVPPLIKRIKIVNNGSFAEARRLTNSMTDSSCLDDDNDNDSDCYHVHSENDIITEEEDDDPDQDQPAIHDDNGDDDDDDEFEEIPDDYDEEDGDDEDEVEEDGDFHEVVTRDMTSSTTGNNHIVLTIKKTPSKTNSPSSSSMSPAPPLIQNQHQNQNVFAKMSLNSPPTIIQSTAGVAAVVAAMRLEKNFLDVTSHQESHANKMGIGKVLDLNRVNAHHDLVTKTDFFLPETTDIAIYNFQLKKNGDNDHSPDHDHNNDRRVENDNADMIPIEINDSDNDDDGRQEEEEILASNVGESNVERGEEETRKSDDDTKKTMEKEDDTTSSVLVLPPKKELVTKIELSESIQLTKKHLRQIELKKRLREGIEQAQKLHRQLFFPYELHTSIGSKILEINSCTSDCTDPSDDETTDTSDNSDTDDTTSSSSGNGNLKSRVMLKRRRKTKQQPSSKRRTTGGGGNPPSSSSSSSLSSSSSSDSSSSASAFTSWTTSSDDDDDKGKRKPKAESESANQEEDQDDSKEKQESEALTPQQSELPAANNFLLRSFNHIYVSTEERQRQQQLKQASEYRQHHEVVNSGYITLSGDDSKDETPLTMAPFYDSNHPRYNVVYGSNQKSAASTSGVMSASSATIKSSSNEQIGVAAESSSPLTTIEDTSVDVETIEPSSVHEVEAAVENTSSTVIMSAVDTVDLEKVDPTKSATTNIDSNYRINPDRSSIGSSSNNINNNNNNNNTSVQLNHEQQLGNVEAAAASVAAVTVAATASEEIDDDLVAQEEYRTGMRRVDEDVDDEDGNNCARTQQFKEWHEVLQLRSYNDELLTVLPYVVIE